MGVEVPDTAANQAVAVDQNINLILLAIDDQGALSLELHWVLWLGLLLIAVFSALWGWRRFNFKSYEIDEAEFGIGDQKVKIRPNTIDCMPSAPMGQI